MVVMQFTYNTSSPTHFMVITTPSYVTSPFCSLSVLRSWFIHSLISHYENTPWIKLKAVDRLKIAFFYLCQRWVIQFLRLSLRMFMHSCIIVRRPCLCIINIAFWQRATDTACSESVSHLASESSLSCESMKTRSFLE